MSKKVKLSLLTIPIIILIFIIILYTKDNSSLNKEKLFAENNEKNHIHKFEKSIDNETGKVIYTCPMHPSVISDKPGNCPICGMSLVKKQKSVEQTSEKLNDLKKVSLSPTQQILANVETEPVKEINLDKEITTVGKITHDETKVYHITSLIDGRVQKIYSNYTGALTVKGSKMIDIYSPELVATQEEYLQAYDFYNKFKDNEFSDISESSSSLLEAAKKRLLLWDISESQIKDLERTKKPKINMTLFAPETGVLMKKSIEEGHFVKKGDMLFDIVDLSKVWMEADIYEYEMSQVKTGQIVEITTDAYPGEKFSGQITFIHPFLNSTTRTVKVRAEFNNSKLRLKPEMFVNASIKVLLGKSLVIPKTSVLITGKRNLVWIQKEKGIYIPKEVQLGNSTEEYYVVLNGLNKNDILVNSAGFLIDSESQLNSISNNINSDQIESQNKEYKENIQFLKDDSNIKNKVNEMDMSDLSMDDMN